MHDDAQGPAGTYSDGRLDVEVPLNEALAGPIGGRLRRLLQRLDEVAVDAPKASWLPTPSTVASAMPFSSFQVWRSTSSDRPA